jgi:thiol-disulfide isomerase/thioredoxin
MFASESKRAKRKFRARSYISLFCVLAFLLDAGCFAQVQDNALAAETENTSAGTVKTVEVTIKLEGKTVKGTPKVVPSSSTFAAMFEKVKDSVFLKLEKVGKNTWRCNAVEGQEYVIGWIVKKGWFEKRSKMFGYCSEPFSAKEGLTVQFSPGMPATFEYDLRKPPKGVVGAPAEVLLLRETVKNGKKSFLSWGGKGEIKKKGILEISGLAAGTYQISARAKDQEKYLTSRTPFLYEDRVIEIKAGSANRFTPVYPEIDSTVEEGDVTIRGTLYGPDKQPMANKIVNVIPLAENGFDRMLYYPKATTDSNGNFEFVGIRPNSMVYVSSGDTSISLGEESLTENAIVSADIVTGVKAMPIETGKPLRDIIIDWKDGKTGNISDFAGKTIVIDVWATWCAPCIRAFPEVNSIAKEFSRKNEIIFVALSIDYDKAVWEKTFNDSNWNSLKHGWLDRTKNLFTFGHPIPYTLIIDKKGIIRSAGNGIDIKRELEKITESHN